MILVCDFTYMLPGIDVRFDPVTEKEMVELCYAKSYIHQIGIPKPPSIEDLKKQYGDFFIHCVYEFIKKKYPKANDNLIAITIQTKLVMGL